MMRLVPLEPEHLAALHDKWADEILRVEAYFAALKKGPNFAGVLDDGQVVGVMGMVEQNPGNFRCWAITDDKLLPRYLAVVCKHMRRAMRGLRRVETVVQEGNEAACRWVELLGFGNRHLMSNFNEFGNAWLYELVTR